MRRIRTFGIALALVLSTSVQAAEWVVEIYNYYFLPANVVVAPGDTVTWLNMVMTAHDSTHANLSNPLWITEPFGRGETFSFTFNQTGEYPYVCITHLFDHPEQTGLVVVAQMNLPPSVRIVNPTNGATLPAPASFTITAEASDADGTVTNVQFFVNGAPAGHSQGPTFSVDLSGLGAGSYSLTAVATDNLGATNISGAVNISVQQFAKFPLSVFILPPEGGIVTVGPPQPADGYDSGTLVTLRATAADGFAFNGWSGDATGTQNPLSVTMDRAKNITANFSTNTLPTFTLTLVANPPNGGTIQASPAPNAAGGKYTQGTVVTLTAAPALNFAFTNWTGDVGSTSNSIAVIIDADKTLTANFIPAVAAAYTLTRAVTPANAGTVAVTPGSANGTYPAGTLLALAAEPNAGFRFVQWSGAVSSTNNPIPLVMDGNKSVTANFEAIPLLDFAQAGGVYAGLLLDERETNYTTSGFCSVRLSKSGAYRGTATIGGMREFIAGQFDRFGYAPLVVRRASLSGSLQIDSAGHRMTGSLTDYKNPNPISRKSPTPLLYRSTAATNPASFAGNYALMFEPREPVVNPGMASLQILANGTVRLRGTLGDGTAFHKRSFLSPDGRIPLFVQLYHNRGAILGWLDVAEEGTVQGTVRWFRPADSRSVPYPSGFALRIPVTGSRAD